MKEKDIYITIGETDYQITIEWEYVCDHTKGIDYEIKDIQAQLKNYKGEYVYCSVLSMAHDLDFICKIEDEIECEI